MKQAQAKATEIVTQAQTKSKEIRQASQEFSDEVLRKAEESLAGSLAEVRQTRQALKGAQRQFAQQNNPVPAGLVPQNIPRAVRVAGSSFCCLAGQRRRCASRHDARNRRVFHIQSTDSITAWRKTGALCVLVFFCAFVLCICQECTVFGFFVKKRPERMAFFTEKWYSVLRQSWFFDN